MKSISKLFLFLIVFCQSINLLSQCAGEITYTLSPVSPDNTYAPGSTVELCITMNGWNGNSQGSNWLEGFGLTLGTGWISSTPISSPSSASGDGTWLWVTSVTSASTGLTAGPGYFFEGPTGPTDGDPGNDWGDFCLDGLCVWEFCVTLEVANVGDPLSLSIGVTPYADGSMGSWGTESCFDTESPIFDGTIGCITVGCTDPTACNFDPLAGCDDGSCTPSGCMDNQSCNFNPLAGCDDGSCVYPGCTDINACNFSTIAGCDDGSCEYFTISDIVHQMIPCPDTVCINSNESYNVTGNVNSFYEWSLSGGGFLSTNGDNTCDIFWGNNPGQYSLNVREITPSGCQSDWETCTIEVIVPTINFDTTNYSICLDGMITLSASPQGGDWNSPFILGSNFNGTTPGSHQVSYTTEIQGCIVTDFVTVNVKPKSQHPTLIVADTIVNVCEEPMSQVYTVLQENGVTYTWTIDNLTYESFYNSINITWPDTTIDYIFSVWGTDTLGCESEQRKFLVHTENCSRVYAPNTFTPNNDGLNDLFTVSGIGIYEPTLVILNRWGDTFYQTNDLYRGWNGNNGTGYYSQDGVYNWKLYYTDYNNFRRETEGFVYLLR
jgi:gliding motility-associated-like protein